MIAPGKALLGVRGKVLENGAPRYFAACVKVYLISRISSSVPRSLLIFLQNSKDRWSQ